MEKEHLKSGLTIRGDSLYCPLALGLDTYGNCSIDCCYCYCRNLNRIWGQDLRPLDLEHFQKTLHKATSSKHTYRDPLMRALQQRKTIRFGNKSDPFPPEEESYRVSYEVLRILKSYGWNVKLETKSSSFAMEYADLLIDMKAIITFTLTVGLDSDWELFEGHRTSPPIERLKAAQTFHEAGLQVGFIGEPFIPGYHSVQQFEESVAVLNSYQINRYNTYNLHLNPFVADRLSQVEGLDIEKVWVYNQDEKWKPILQQLIDISKKHNIILGCPDFANSGRYMETSNTCCGVDVDNPCTFNFINWKRELLQKGKLDSDYLKSTWDGVGNWDSGYKHFFGLDSEFYSWGDTDFACVKKNEVILTDECGGFLL